MRGGGYFNCKDDDIDAASPGYYNIKINTYARDSASASYTTFSAGKVAVQGNNGLISYRGNGSTYTTANNMSTTITASPNSGYICNYAQSTFFSGTGSSGSDYTVNVYYDRVSSISPSSMFSGGGTSSNPYQIGSLADLQKLADDVANGNTYAGKYFRQTANISNQGIDMMPIGYSSNQSAYFAGIYDGNGYSINARISLSYDYGGVGVFGRISNATIRNVVVSSGWSIGAGNASACGLVGVATNSTIENCINRCTISSKNTAGGICGSAGSNVTIRNCKNYASITTPGMTTGGIVGIIGPENYNSSDKSKVENSINYGSVKGDGHVGGIAGYSTATISGCLNLGTVTGTSTAQDYCGGIVGKCYNNVSDCIQTGTVKGSGDRVGGIAGDVYRACTLSGCYVGGTINFDTTKSYHHMFAGRFREAGGRIENCCFVGTTNRTFTNLFEGGQMPTIVSSYIIHNGTKIYKNDSNWTSAWGIVGDKPLQTKLFWISSVVKPSQSDFSTLFSGWTRG